MTVLAETTQQMPTQLGYICLIIAVIITVIVILAIIEGCKKYTLMILLLVVLLSVFVGAVLGFESHRKIKAIISDDYSAVELYNKYDVTEQEGKIWVLVEKEPKEDEE